MAAQKAYDLAVKTGEYTNAAGEVKGRYTNIGAVMAGDNGSFALLDPSVDLAGCLLKQNVLASKAGKQLSESVMCSMFEPRDQQQQAPQQQAPQPQQQYQQPQQQPPMQQPQPQQQQSQQQPYMQPGGGQAPF